MRLAGTGSSDYIDRAAEAANARLASQLGVNVELLYIEESSGLMLTRFLENSRPLSAVDLRDRGTLQRVAHTLARLHASGPVFVSRFEPFEQLASYQAVLARLGANSPPDFESVRAEVERVRLALGRHPTPLVACHCDPLAENFLDDGQRLYLIDFEYSGNSDPMWDLGDLSVEAGFDSQQDRALLQAYLGAPATPYEHGRMVMYKALCDLLWTLWGAVRHAQGRPGEDFWSYATHRLRRCRGLLESPEFSHHLAAVEQGPEANCRILRPTL